MNYKITVAYDGTNFHGWAKQNKIRTVEQTIEDILKKIYKKEIRISGSGRTDAFVHAKGQVFSFKENKILLNSKQLLSALCAFAPRDLQFINVKPVNDDFHARFSAKEKQYIYHINCGKYRLFENNYLFNLCENLDLIKMLQASKLFLGKHDFLSFSTTQIEDTVRTIKNIKITQKGNVVKITCIGNGFLRNMVRMIAAVLVDVGLGIRNENDIKQLLLAPKKGSSIKKLPGCGLYLVKVIY